MLEPVAPAQDIIAQGMQLDEMTQGRSYPAMIFTGLSQSENYLQDEV
ncbi:MAG: hypothetical protein JW941_01985 [Candidatus Coatesbacteria bacterium]|nr:hypothetical protein [Candidatus Coatesbacteria bacterium]